MDLTKLQDMLLNWLVIHGLKIVVILIGFYIAQRVLNTVIHHIMDRVVRKSYHERGEAAMGKRQDTLENVASVTLKTLLWIVAGLMMLSEIGLDIAPLLAGAGIAGLAFGFGGQYLIRDLISGLFIIVEDQYRNGDVIKIANITGKVASLNLRRTVLRDLDGVEHHIPNGVIDTTSNMTKFWSRINLDIGVSYDTNLDKATKVLNRVCEELAKSPEWKDDIIATPKVIGVNELGDSAITLKILGDIKPGKQWAATRTLRQKIKIAFDKEEIEIPFPHIVTVKK